MALIEADLRTYLLTKTAITDLVSTRIYPLKAPQGAAYPHIVYQKITGEHIRSMGGSKGQATPTIQISCYGTTYSSVKAVVDAVRVSCDGFNSTMGSTRVRSCFLLNEVDLYEPPERADDVGVYHTACDYRLAHAETVPTL